MVALVTIAVPAAAVPLPIGTELVPSTYETTPSSWSGDWVDDPANLAVSVNGGNKLQPAREASGKATTGGAGLSLYDPGVTGVQDGL
jgi:hypothetical protein